MARDHTREGLVRPVPGLILLEAASVGLWSANLIRKWWV